MKTVCVIGAGVVGCATAYALRRQGFQGILLDAQAGPGEGASRANGAQLSYSYVEPLASPATLRALPALLSSQDSPLRFSPRMDWRQWHWGVRFLLACTGGQVRRGTRELLALAQLSRTTLDDWCARENLAISLKRNGKLVLCPDDGTLERQVRQLEFQAALGCRQSVLTPAQCLAQEPALGTAATGIAGGIWTPDECLADPYELCQALVRCLQRDGARLQFNTRVDGFVVRRGKAVAVRAAGHELAADAFVLATGASAARLGASLGMVLPVYPVKGYSLTLPLRDASRAPRASVTHLGLKTVFAPLRDQLRVAAMAEVVGHDLRIPQDRVDRMLEAVERLFPGACALEQPAAWAGLRPATPDSLPIIGPSRVVNVFLNIGHGALGFTLAAGSAMRLAWQMAAGGAAAMQRPVASALATALSPQERKTP